MRLINLIIFLVVTLTNPSIGRAQSEIPWLQSRLDSIARITAQPCRIEAICPKNVGSGFVWRPVWSDSDTPLIVTALHLVAGSGEITVQFTNASSDIMTSHTAQIIAVNRDADIAFLSIVSEWNPAAHPPLEMASPQGTEREVFVFGYRDGLGTIYVEDGKRNIVAPQLLRDYISDPDTREAFIAVGYPSLDVQVAAVGQALRPGDSGAPVLNPDGLVVGMAQGGVPRIGSWMIPSEVILSAAPQTENIDQLMALDVRNAYAAQALYREDAPMPMDGNPSLYFEVKFPATGPLLGSYGNRLRDESWRLDGFPSGQFSGTVIGTEHRLFPGGGDLPESCLDDQARWDCPNQYPEEERFLNVLSKATLSLDCFRVESFLALVRGEATSFWSADMSISLPLGDLRRRIQNREVLLEVNYFDVPAIYFTSNGFIELREGGPGYDYSTNELHSLVELFGGACQIYLDVPTSMNQEENQLTEQLTELYRRGAICVYVKIGDDRLPISLTGLLSFSGSLNRANFWGMLPLGRVDAPFSDFHCV